ncbi:MAG: hypothetical protein WEB52_06470 [Dehalococcoidia bacterium]
MHSSLLATGDAFNGYLQILRYSEDPALRSRAASPEARRNAMQQLLWLNTNKMAVLAVADRSGLVLESTDGSIQSVRGSAAFNESRANLGPANSDIVLPEGGERGYVEYSAPLRDPDGTVWGFLYARAEPQVLWSDTLNASIDGGHNVIINSEGVFSAGVPDELLRQPWSGSTLGNGSVRAEIAGVEAICGLGAIGRDTQIDHGWFVASCLPASLIQVEAGRALGNQGQITIAGAVLAVVIAIGLLRIALGSPAPPAVAQHPDEMEDADAPFEVEEGGLAAETHAVIEAPEASPGEPEAGPAEPAAPIVVIADVDALAVMDAYERRNALLSNELRESIQARLMIAVTQAEEAYNLSATDPDRAIALHRAAMDELESVRERGLRGMGQELHPSLVRLGLPGALRSLKKEFADRVTIDLQVDANVDGASSRGGRVTIDNRLRLIVYRVIRDAVRTAYAGRADSVTIAIQRDGLEITAAVTSKLSGGDADAARETLLAGEVALRAFGGSLTVDTEGALRVIARVLAPNVAQPEPLISARTEDDDAIVAQGTLHADSTASRIEDDLQATAHELASTVDIRFVSTADSASLRPADELCIAMIDVLRVAAAGFSEAGANTCDASLKLEHDAGELRISARTLLSMERLDDIRQRGEQAGCSISIARDASGMSIALRFDLLPQPRPAIVRFALPEDEPSVIPVSEPPPYLAPVLPATAVTFRIPDGGALFESMDEAAGMPVAAVDDVLPSVVQVSSLAEVIPADADAVEGEPSEADAEVDATALGDGDGRRSPDEDAA